MIDELVRQFVPEARDLIENVSGGLLQLERDPLDEQALNRVFRAMHTLKGTAGIFDIPAFIRLAHAAEDLLGAVRAREAALDVDMVDLLLSVADRLGVWIDGLASEGRLPSDASKIGEALGDRVRARMPEASVAGSPSDGRGQFAAAAAPVALHAFTEAGVAAARAAQAEAGPDARILAVAYRPEPECFFKGEDPLHLVRQMPELHDLAIAFAGPAPAISDLDVFSSALTFKALTTAPLAELEHLFRFVPEQVDIAPIDAEAPSDLEGRADGRLSLAALGAQGRALAEAQTRMLAADVGGAAWKDRAPAACETLIRTFEAQGFRARERLSLALDRALAEASFAPISDCVAAEDAARADADVEGAAAADAAADASAATDRVLKVEQSRVDALMDLVGELIVAKNALPYLARRAEAGLGGREIAREIKTQFSALDRISQEMQGAIMSVRMMPVGSLFQRYPRLVRDTARKLGKQIELRLDGEDTEADKNVIEALSDPLLHVVRNCLDHGLETPDERRSAGKSERGVLSLRASQEGDRVCIEITDDGRGIDPEMVRAKAIERGVIDADRAAALSDREAVHLCFAAGFSTRDVASDLSGRGVGMDVVRTAVERFGGDVELESEVGVGTRISLRLPLSMAVTRVMMVEADGSLFGIPIEHVSETVRVPRPDIRRFKSAETFVLRNALIPLVRLREKLAMGPDARGQDTEAVLVCRLQGAPFGLIVDDFNVGMDVVLKPMAGILAGMPGLAGTSVLGNGQVLLVLNLKEII